MYRRECGGEGEMRDNGGSKSRETKSMVHWSEKIGVIKNWLAMAQNTLLAGKCCRWTAPPHPLFSQRFSRSKNNLTRLFSTPPWAPLFGSVIFFFLLTSKFHLIHQLITDSNKNWVQWSTSTLHTRLFIYL